MEKTLERLITHCEAQLGLPYLYGEFGRVVTPQIIQEKHKQYPDMTSAARAARALKTHVGKRCYDCSHLISSCWMQETPTSPPKYSVKYDQNAQGLYDLCKQRGKIGSMAPERGDLVFMYGERRGVRRMTHVGICIGGGFVIEARGFDYGVVKTKLSGRAWTHCGRGLSWLEYKDTTAPEKPAQGLTGALQKGNRARVKPGTKEYFPGLKMPEWVPGKVYTVSQALINGVPFVQGGKVCVLLGELVTWCAVEYLEKVED